MRLFNAHPRRIEHRLKTPAQSHALQLLFHRADRVRDNTEIIALVPQAREQSRNLRQHPRPERDIPEALGDPEHQPAALAFWRLKDRKSTRLNSSHTVISY